MAEVSNPFNPAYPDKHEETYLNYSKGADAPHAMKGKTNKIYDNTISNVGNLFAVGIEAKDAAYKNRIRKETTEMVDAVRDPWIGTSTGQGSPDANVPADLVKQGDRLSRMTEAYKAGRINDRHYWAQMENIARSVRARYPGYREYIDNVISDITGGTPANVLQRSIAAEARQSDSEENRRLNLVEAIAKDSAGIPLPPGYNEMSTPQLLEYYNGAKVALGDIQRREDALKRASTEGQYNSDQANQLLRQKVLTEIGFQMQPQIKEFQARLQTLLQDGKTPPPDEVIALGQMGARLKADWLARFDNIVLSDPIYANIEQSKIDQTRAYIETIGGDLTAALQEGGDKWTVVKAYADRLDMLVQGEASDLAREAPDVITASAINKLLGPEFATRYAFDMRDGQGLNLSRMDQQILQHHLMKSMDPAKEGKTPAVQTLDNIANSSRVTNKPESMNLFLQKQEMTLTSPDANLYSKERAALNMFGEGNQDFLQFFSPKDNANPNKDMGMSRISKFKQFTSPQITKALAELRDKSPRGQEIWENYINWRDYSFNTLMKTELDTMSRIPTDDQTLNISFDSSTGKVIATEITPDNPTWDRPASWLLGSRKSVNRYNAMIDAMTPGWKEAGLNPGDEALKLIENAGIDFNAPKGKNLVTQFWDAVSERAANSESKVTATDGRESLKRNLGLNKGEFKGFRLGSSGEGADMASTQEFRDFLRKNRRELARIGDEIEKMELDGSAETDPEKYQNLLIDFQILTDPNALQGGSSGSNGPFPASEDGFGSLEGVMDFLRNRSFTPGPRESTNIEDRRGENNLLERAFYWYANHILLRER